MSPMQNCGNVLRFWKRGKIIELNDVPPDRMLLDVLREDLRICDVKEGCAAGDCGACTVVIAHSTDGVKLNYQAINSCIRPAHAVHGMALLTAADLANENELHPSQAALIAKHGTQCGFCTPGIVMSLFALYQRTCAKGRDVSKAQATDALSGNLCRCTGYRSIIDAALSMSSYSMPVEDEKEISVKLKEIAARDPEIMKYDIPTDLLTALKLRAKFSDAQLIAGATDVGIWVKQGMRQLTQIIDLHRVEELLQIEVTANHLCVGAAVPLQEAFNAIAKDRPKVQEFARRFAGWPVRQSGTLGGNVANGSPIGDSMPLLLALDATVVLKAWRDHKVFSRELPLSEFYLGYRQHALAMDEILVCIKIPHPKNEEWLGLYKVSKRHEDDISAVCMVIRVDMQGRYLDRVRIGVGGVAPTPIRAISTEEVFHGKEDTHEIWLAAQSSITNEFAPISDLRASGEYRKELLGNLIKRAYLERTNHSNMRLEDLA